MRRVEVLTGGSHLIKHTGLWTLMRTVWILYWKSSQATLIITKE